MRGDFVYDLNLMSSTEEEYDDLCRKDSKEHSQRVNRRIAQGWSLLRADTVRVGESRGIGISAGYHTCNGKVVELVAYAGYRSDNEDGDDGDEETS